MSILHTLYAILYTLYFISYGRSQQVESNKETEGGK
jgi:hypothetical protein